MLAAASTYAGDRSTYRLEWSFNIYVSVPKVQNNDSLGVAQGLSFSAPKVQNNESLGIA
jgi:hypothetical protein